MNPQTTLASVSTGFRCIMRIITTESLCKHVCIKMATLSKSHVSVKVGTSSKLLLTHITLVWRFSSIIVKKTSQFKTVCKDDSGCITQLKQQKSKR